MVWGQCGDGVKWEEKPLTAGPSTPIWHVARFRFLQLGISYPAIQVFMHVLMNGWADGWMDGRTDGRTDGQMVVVGL